MMSGNGIILRAVATALLLASVAWIGWPIIHQKKEGETLRADPLPGSTETREVVGTRPTQNEAPGEKVRFFIDQGCPDCAVVKNELLPLFLDLEGLTVEDVEYLDVAKISVVQDLLRLESELGFRAEVLAPVVVFRGRGYCGVASLRRAIEAFKGAAGSETGADGEGR